jgi:hypothetical protein
MEQQEQLPGTTSKSRGRKDRDGGEQIIRYEDINKGADGVMKLFRKAESAKTNLNEGIKALAERSGTNVGVLKKLFKASFNGNFEDCKRDVDQAADLFQTIGEIPGGGKTAE